MNRYAWMVVRAYLPALLALALAVIGMTWTSVSGNVHALSPLVPYVKWLPPIALLAALVAGLVATLRLWRWQSGKTPLCAGCGGPLGRLQQGPQGSYRKCLACGARQPP